MDFAFSFRIWKLIIIPALIALAIWQHDWYVLLGYYIGAGWSELEDWLEKRNVAAKKNTHR